MADELTFMSAVDLLAAFEDKTISPVEATKAALSRIAALDGKFNAFCHLDEEQALAQAAASEARWAKGAPMGPLDGVPTSIKDLAYTKGMPTRFGSRTTDAEAPCEVDAPFVARLREAGAVLLGKTTTPEYGWKGLTDSPLSGVTRNPWDANTNPGGSSGGAAVALAAGMCTLSTGSDGGGSIRIPAAFTGVFGIKMNFGRIPVYPEGAMRSLSHAGPMARSVADAALMANVMCGPDDRDWTALPYDEIDWRAGLEDGVAGLKIGISTNLGYAKVNDEVAAAVAVAAELFGDLGAHVEAADPDFNDPIDCFNTHWFAGAAGAMGDTAALRKDDMDPGFVAVIDAGRKISVRQYTDAMTIRGDLARTMREYHRQYDLLLTPALAEPAFPLGRIAPEHYGPDAIWTDWTPFTYPFNLTQQPACVINCGHTAGGLPIGLQIVAGSFREDLVLRAARAYEAARDPIVWPEL